jgi:hypothetical protein
VGMADDMQLMQMLRNYQLPPEQPAGYQPLQQPAMPPQAPPAQPMSLFPGLSVETNLQGRAPQDLARQLRYHPYWLQYNRQF